MSEEEMDSTKSRSNVFAAYGATHDKQAAKRPPSPASKASKSSVSLLLTPNCFLFKRIDVFANGCHYLHTCMIYWSKT